MSFSISAPPRLQNSLKRCILLADLYCLQWTNSEGGDVHGEKIVPRGSGAELARLLGITDRRVRQLADEEILTREPEGDYLLPEVIAEYYAYKYKTDESVDLMKEKALHEKAKRELAEIQLAQKRREMHDAADVEAVLTEILVNFRNQIRGIPSKMAPLLFGKSKPEIEELLSMEVEGRLEEIRDYTPTMFDAVDEKEGD